MSDDSPGRPPDEGGLARRLGLDAVLAAIGARREPLQIGRYTLDRRVGAGGMGVVFRARDNTSGAFVAVKLLERATPDLRERFAREVRILRTLVHPRIVRYLDDGLSPEGAPFLVMEWLEGRDLAQRMQAGPVSVADALRIGIAAARGLEAAHAVGIVHRDVKPANLFLVGEAPDDVRVIDFGIARTGRVDGQLTATGVMVGTPSYMAPEQLQGEHGVPADIWGLAVTLFELLTGRVPFPGRDPAAVMLAVSRDPLPSLTALRSDAPRELELLLARMLAPVPAHRPHSMAAVVTELADLRVELGVRPFRATGVSLREQTPRPRVPRPDEAEVDETLCGRERPLGQLRGLVRECLEDSVCVVSLMTGVAGFGRTAVSGAFAAELAAFHPAVRVLRAAGQPAFRGSPFGLLAALLTTIETSGKPGEAGTQALRTLLAQLTPGANEPLPEALVLADALRVAWLALVESWAASGPLVWLVDDAHEADLVSLRFLARASSHLAMHPAFFLLTARAGHGESELVSLFGAEAVVRVPLAPLRPVAMERLAARWAPEASDGRRAHRVAQAAGNPAHLRALSRRFGVASEAEVDDTDSAATLVWERLRRLDPDARRLLRAASIVGSPFTADLLAAVLGGEAHPVDVEARLSRLAGQGVLRGSTPHTVEHQSAGVAGAAGVAGVAEAPDYAFESELIRAASHALLTPADLTAGHLAAAEALRLRGGAAPARIARHYVAAGAPGLAAPWLVQSARMALAGGDAGLLAELVSLGLSQAESAAQRAEFLMLSAEAAYWDAAVERALNEAQAAVDVLERGSAAWLRAQSLVLTAYGQLGRNDQLFELADELFEVVPEPTSMARDAHCICLGRIGTQASTLPGGAPLAAQAREFLGRSLQAGGLGPVARAWAWRAAPEPRLRAYDATILAFTHAHEAHVESHDHRSAAQVQLYLGSYYCWTGAWARAAEVIEDACRTARLLGAEYLEVWGDYVRGKLLAETGGFERARDVLTRVIRRSTQSPRIRAGAQLYLSLAAARAGAFAAAVDAARGAFEDPAAASLRGPSTAALARALVLDGQPEAAVALLPALRQAARDEHLEFDELVRLALVEVLYAAGEDAAPGEADRALEAAQASLQTRAATLANPWRRHEYLRGPHANARTLELAERMGRATH